MLKRRLLLSLTGLILLPGLAASQQVRIGTDARVPENPRSRYCRYVNWRPADGEVVSLNPPRMSWPLRADWPEEWGSASHRYTLQIAGNDKFADPLVNVTCGFNFYNTIPALEPGGTYFWRVGYDIGSDSAKWSPVRRFTIAPDATEWDRSALAEPDLATIGHPRVLLNRSNLAQVRSLAETDPGSKAALAYMVRKADQILAKDWWADFPPTDREPEPKQSFYTIAHDLATVAFVWKITGEDKYSGVVERSVTWASYPPGGRASPEGLGGDGNEDATQGNEFLALLFDWLYADLSEEQQKVMIASLEWRVAHIMNRFSFRAGGSAGPMLRLTFSSGENPTNLEVEAFELSGGARIIDNEKASGGKLVELAGPEAEASLTTRLGASEYLLTVRGHGPSADQDAFHVRIDDGKPMRLYINGWGEASTRITVRDVGEHRISVLADSREVGMTVDAVSLSLHGDRRLKLPPSPEWREYAREIPVPSGATRVTVEPFNYYSAGQVHWDSVHLSADPGGAELVRNPDFSQADNAAPTDWRYSRYKTESKPIFTAKGGRNGTGLAGIDCPASSDRGAWSQGVSLEDVDSLHVSGWYRTSAAMQAGPVKSTGMAGMISSHAYEAAMDTAACGLVLYEHSTVGREWFEVVLNYLLGITVGHGFDEGWNEGAGYGTSKCKWLMNATMYFDTALPQANMGRNPRYRVLGDWFSRIIPVGMGHHAWGNQRNASRGNHLAHFRKFAYLTGEGRFLLNWQQYGGKEFSTWRPWIEYCLPAYYDEPTPEPEKEFAALYPIEGWAMAATGPPSLRATYENGAGVIFQCRPRGGYSHSFNSDGSMQLHAYGQMLNHGGGSSGNQDAYAYHTMSHSTVLVDGLGQAQPNVGMAHPTYGRIVGYETGEDYAYFAGDVTRCYPSEPGSYRRWGLPLDNVYAERALPYLQRFIRHVLFIKGEYFVIYDDLRCSRPARYTWLYHILPDTPAQFDPDTFSIDYKVGDVPVRLQHISRPDGLEFDDRQGEDGLVNPFTGEDYRQWRKGDILCGHNLWVTNREASKTWQFLAVVYPARPGETPAEIKRLDDHSVQVGEDVITFDPRGEFSERADFVIDPGAVRE